MTATISKEGLDYFPFDVNFLFDLRTRRLMKTHGPELIYAYINLSASIYRQNGYYAACDEELIFITSESMFIDEEKISGLIRKCVDAGLFDQEKYEKYGILTSREIQKNFLFATKRRKEVFLKEEYLIGNEENEKNEKEDVTTEKHNVTTCIHDVDKTKQSNSKRESNSKSKKESKNKKREDVVVSVEGEPSSPMPPPTPPPWRMDYKIYLKDLEGAYLVLINNEGYIRMKKKYYPKVDIRLSIEKMISDFWGTRHGWEAKKKQTNDKIDWKFTFNQQFNYSHNLVIKN